MNSFQSHQWWVNPLACTLENSVTIKLDYKQMQLLCYLADKADKVITRSELLDEIWPNQHIADDVLNVAISGLRKALGDDSKAPKFIKTIPRVGYQYIAPVSFTKTKEQTQTHINQTRIHKTTINKATIRPRILMLAGAMFSVIVTILIWFTLINNNSLGNLDLTNAGLNGGSLTDASKPKPKLAILPMSLHYKKTGIDKLSDTLKVIEQRDNNTPDTSKQYLANGIIAAIIDDLAGNPELSVLSRQTMFHPDRLNTSEAQFLASLDADYHMHSSMTFENEKLEISAQLLHSNTQQVLWERDYSVDQHAIFQTQIQIVSEINQRFATSQITTQPPKTTEASSDTLVFTGKAYDHFLKGQRSIRDNMLKDAETQFLSSVNEASNFAPGYAALAQLYFLKAWGGAEKTLDYLQVAERYAQKAWQLAPSDPAVLLNKALSAYFLEYELEKAQSYFERAQQKNPSDVMLLEWFQSFLINTGQFEKAKTINQQMRDVSPLLFNKTAYYDILYLSGDYEGALMEIESVNPHMNSKLWVSAASSWIYLAKRKTEQFARHFVHVLQSFNLSSIQIENFQHTLSAQGIEAAISLVLQLTEDTLDDYSKAELLAYIGESDKAINILEQKVNNREIQMFRLAQEPLFRSLHDNPRFQELLNHIRTPVR